MNELRPTLVRRATLEANSISLCGITIEKYAFVAAGTVVIKDVSAHALGMGNLGRVTGWHVCKVNFVVNWGKASCSTCGRQYLSDKTTGMKAS